jgi:hypothetical protein
MSKQSEQQRPARTSADAVGGGGGDGDGGEAASSSAAVGPEVSVSGRPASPAPPPALRGIRGKFMRWEDGAFDGITTRHDRRATKKAAATARRTPGYVGRLAAAITEQRGARGMGRG